MVFKRKHILWPLLLIFLLFSGIAVYWGKIKIPLADCRSRLRSIAFSLVQYTADYEGEFPPGNDAKGLNILVSTGFLVDKEIYICPAAGRPVYCYLAGASYRWKDCPVVFEPPGTHPGNRVNIGFTDCRVEEFKLPKSVDSVKKLIVYLAEQAKEPEVREFLLKNANEFSKERLQ